MSRIQVTVRGDQLDSVQAMLDRLQDLVPLWRRIGDTIADREARQWGTDGAAEGTPWRPLNPHYVRWKVQHHFDQRILRQRGDLRASVVGRPMAIERYEGNSAVYGTDDDKAAWMKFGTTRNGQEHVPARPFLVVNDELTSTVTSKTRAFLERGDLL